MTPRESLRKFLRRQIRNWWQDHQWPVIGIIGLLALALGYIGFKKYFDILGESRSLWDIFYLTLQLFVLESGSVSAPVSWELEVARLLAPTIAAYAAVRAFAVIFREQFKLLRMRFFKDHVVLCGLGRKGMLLAQKFREKRESVTVIELDEGNDLLDQCRDRGAIVLVGDATDQEMLRKARVHKAKYLISTCGDDGVNAEVAVHARNLVKRRRSKFLTCFAHIVDPQLCHLLGEKELEAGKIDNYRLEFFNIFDRGALLWLKDHSPFTDAEGKSISRPHLLIVGVGQMGESLIVHSIQARKDLSPESSEKFFITLIDKEAENRKESLCLQYSQLKKACDLTPLQMDIKSPAFQRADFLFGDNKECDVTSIFICLDDDSFALSTALTLHQHTKKYKIPLVVRMAREAGLATLLQGEEGDDNDYTLIQAFGLLDRTCQPEQILEGKNEIIARAIHEDYRERQKSKGQTPEENPSIVSWEKLPEDLKKSNRHQADHIRIKLIEMGFGIAPLMDWDEELFEFTEKEVEQMAIMEHERWVEERRRSGWKYGAKKNIKKKKTPYLVPWEELDDEMREEDREPVRNLPLYLAKIGYKIYRLK